MKLVIFQLITIVMMAWITVRCWLRVWRAERDAKSNDESYWVVQMQKMGNAPKDISHFLRKYKGMNGELELPLGVFFAGNRWTDTIYLAVNGERVRLYLNVQKKEIVLTVLEGKIQTKNGIYEADQRKQISLQEFSKILIGDVELQFFRKKVK